MRRSIIEHASAMAWLYANPSGAVESLRRLHSNRASEQLKDLQTAQWQVDEALFTE